MIDGMNILTLNAHVGAAERSMNARLREALESINRANTIFNSVSVEEIEVLHAITQVDRATDVADYLRKANPTISHVITRLSNHDLIERTQDKGDGRVWRLTLTQKGLSLLSFLLVNLKPINAPEATLGAAQRLAKRVR